MIKLFLVVVAILVSIVSFIRRKNNNRKTKKIGNSIVERVGVDLNFRQDLINELVFLAASKKYTSENANLQKTFSFLNNEKVNQEIQTKYVDFNNNSCLLIVQYSSKDIEYTGMKLELKEVTHLNQFNFLIKRNEQNETYELYSNLFDNLSDKLLRKEVANKILENIV